MQDRFPASGRKNLLLENPRRRLRHAAQALPELEQQVRELVERLKLSTTQAATRSNATVTILASIVGLQPKRPADPQTVRLQRLSGRDRG